MIKWFKKKRRKPREHPILKWYMNGILFVLMTSIVEKIIEWFHK